MSLKRRLGSIRIDGLIIAVFCGAFWFAWAFGCYQGVYLQKNGFSPSDMGVLNAICAAVGIASVAFWGMMSDRIGSIKKIVFILIIAGATLYALVPLIPVNLPYSSILFLVYLPLVNFFRGSMVPMKDNLEVRSCNAMGLNFGKIRSFGSFMFTIGSLIISALLSTFLDVKHTFWIALVLMLPAILLTLKMNDPVHVRKTGETKAKREKLDIRPLLKNGKYISFLLFALVFYIAANTEINFIPYYMADIGVDSGNYGFFLAYRGALEIPLLLLMSRLRKRIKLEYLLLLGVLLMSVEVLLFASFARSLPTMLLSTTFFGLGNGVFIGSSLNYLYELAPNNLKATAQSFFTAVASGAGIIGNLVGGMVFSAMNATDFYFVVFGLYLLSVCVFVVSSRFGKKKAETPEVQAE